MNVSRIYRLLRLVTLLQSGRNYTADQLADDLQVSRRTVFRDLNALELAHIPYYYDPAEKTYRISRHFFLQPVNLTLSEALALLILAGSLTDKTNVPLLSSGAQAAAKLESILPEAIRQHVGSVIERLSLHLGPMARHEGSETFFEQIAAAISRRNVCRMTYESFLEKKTLRLDVHPLRLVFIQRAWYLLAWSPRDKAVRTYKLIRVRKLIVQADTFPPGHEAKLESHFGLAWSMIPEGKLHKVHLHFDPKVAGNVAEVRWHPTQRVEWNHDHSIEFHVQVDGLNEILWWILGYGDQVKVVTPKALAKQVTRVAEAVLAKYKEST
ncbi:MAG: YafY family transcriptional regulator [Phycisphaerae bacterium]|nr:YafY family transcriptional regulator [Phycisphaerae bacterium]